MKTLLERHFRNLSLNPTKCSDFVSGSVDFGMLSACEKRISNQQPQTATEILANYFSRFPSRYERGFLQSICQKMRDVLG